MRYYCCGPGKGRSLAHKHAFFLFVSVPHFYLPWNRFVTVESPPTAFATTKHLRVGKKTTTCFCWKNDILCWDTRRKKLDGGEMATYHSAGAADCGRRRQQASFADWPRLGARSKLRRGRAPPPTPPLVCKEAYLRCSCNSWDPLVIRHKSPSAGSLTPRWRCSQVSGTKYHYTRWNHKSRHVSAVYITVYL